MLVARARTRSLYMCTIIQYMAKHQRPLTRHIGTYEREQRVIVVQIGDVANVALDLEVDAKELSELLLQFK